VGEQEEPENLVALMAEIERRWGAIDLIDILEEAAGAREGTAVARRRRTIPPLSCDDTPVPPPCALI
jgi:hypothetical protein